MRTWTHAFASKVAPGDCSRATHGGCSRGDPISDASARPRVLISPYRAARTGAGPRGRRRRHGCPDPGSVLADADGGAAEPAAERSVLARDRSGWAGRPEPY